MNSNFLPAIDTAKIMSAHAAGNYNELYDLLATPLHEELYRRKTFDFLDDLSEGQQLLLTYDYVRTQVGQGGFIQFIENGYVGLLPDMIAQLNTAGSNEMAQVMDDVLKVFVLNKELLSKPKTVQEFAQLYDELKEFEIIDGRYHKLNAPTIKTMLDYAVAHLNEFAASL